MIDYYLDKQDNIYFWKLIIVGVKSNLKNNYIPKSRAYFIEPEEQFFIKLNASLNLEMAGDL